MTYEEWVKAVERGVTITPEMAFAAGAASRDAELMDVVNKARKFVFELDYCISPGKLPVIELADLREALAKVRKP